MSSETAISLCNANETSELKNILLGTLVASSTDFVASARTSKPAFPGSIL